MNVFLFNDLNYYGYDDLLREINSNKSYYPMLKTSDIFLYFVNLAKALATNQPLVLLDSDLNPSEIEGIDESFVNKSINISYEDFQTIDDLLNHIRQSKSELTIFTSGTTGQPKKVIHNISTLTRNVRTGEKYDGQIWAYAYNPTHMAGLQVFFQAFFNQNALINVFNKQRSEVYTLIEKFSISHISATPTFYRLLLPFEQTYPSVERITLGGEKSDENLYHAIMKIFPSAKINNVYASTEAGSLFAAKGDCFQIPADKIDFFKVVDGELLIHKTLLGKSDNFKYIDDFYCSGDLIEWVDEKFGLFRFKSRKNELINVGGYKVNPGEIENVIRNIESVKEVLVYGKPNSILGNVLCADIQLEPHSEISDLEIKKILKSQLQDFKVPRRIKFVDEFSLTRTGKLKRK